MAPPHSAARTPHSALRSTLDALLRTRYMCSRSWAETDVGISLLCDVRLCPLSEARDRGHEMQPVLLGGLGVFFCYV